MLNSELIGIHYVDTSVILRVIPGHSDAAAPSSCHRRVLLRLQPCGTVWLYMLWRLIPPASHRLRTPHLEEPVIVGIAARRASRVKV